VRCAGRRRAAQRLAKAFGGHARSGITRLRYRLTLDHAALTALVTMGPSARRISQQALAARIHALPSPATVTADLQIRAYRHRHSG
jgi:23S rRNA (guanine745-N1)-methyltransferase